MRVQVHLRADKLGNIARGRWLRGRRSSPYAAVSLSGGSGPEASAGGEIELGKTEVVRDNLSPKWTTIFIVDHDEDQAWTPLKIAVYDSRSSAEKRVENANRTTTTNTASIGGIMPFSVTSRTLPSLYKSSDPTMGEVSVEVGEVLRSEGQEAKLELEHGGCLYVHITESIDRQLPRDMDGPIAGEFHCHIRGLDIENIEKGLLGLGAIDPYFELSKKYTRDGITRWLPVYRSDHIPDIINPYWQPFHIDLEKLCHGDSQRELKIAIWDQEDGARADRWLGECKTSVDGLRRSVTRGGNASREYALQVTDVEEQVIGLIMVLKADVR